MSAELIIGAAVRTPTGRAGVVIPRPPDVHLDRHGEGDTPRVWVPVTIHQPQWAGGYTLMREVLEVEACYDGRDLEVMQ